jgi:hypothetical protein
MPMFRQFAPIKYPTCEEHHKLNIELKKSRISFHEEMKRDSMLKSLLSEEVTSEKQNLRLLKFNPNVESKNPGVAVTPIKNVESKFSNIEKKLNL